MELQSLINAAVAALKPLQQHAKRQHKPCDHSTHRTTPGISTCIKRAIPVMRGHVLTGGSLVMPRTTSWQMRPALLSGASRLDQIRSALAPWPHVHILPCAPPKAAQSCLPRRSGEAPHRCSRSTPKQLPCAGVMAKCINRKQPKSLPIPAYGPRTCEGTWEKSRSQKPAGHTADV